MQTPGTFRLLHSIRGKRPTHLSVDWPQILKEFTVEATNTKDGEPSPGCCLFVAEQEGGGGGVVTLHCQAAPVCGLSTGPSVM